MAEVGRLAPGLSKYFSFPEPGACYFDSQLLSGRTNHVSFTVLHGGWLPCREQRNPGSHMGKSVCSLWSFATLEGGGQEAPGVCLAAECQQRQSLHPGHWAEEEEGIDDHVFDSVLVCSVFLCVH